MSGNTGSGGTDGGYRISTVVAAVKVALEHVKREKMVALCGV